MNDARMRTRAIFPKVVTLALVTLIGTTVPAPAVDLFSRSSEVDLMLEEPSRVKRQRATVELRFLTVDDVFLERIGVDFSGTVSGEVFRNNGPVQGAKLILEVFRVDLANGGGETVRKTGREVVTTDAAGKFSVPMRNLVPSDDRKDILAGKVASLRVEATGKNGKRVDHIHLRGSTAFGGLLED